MPRFVCGIHQNKRDIFAFINNSRIPAKLNARTINRDIIRQISEIPCRDVVAAKWGFDGGGSKSLQYRAMALLDRCEITILRDHTAADVKNAIVHSKMTRQSQHVPGISRNIDVSHSGQPGGDLIS